MGSSGECDYQQVWVAPEREPPQGPMLHKDKNTGMHTQKRGETESSGWWENNRKRQMKPARTQTTTVQSAPK